MDDSVNKIVTKLKETEGDFERLSWKVDKQLQDPATEGSVDSYVKSLAACKEMKKEVADLRKDMERIQQENMKAIESMLEELQTVGCDFNQFVDNKK